ncbi:MAG: hypothetical protein L0154_29275 [Chloroflexi bacterium]|nr:hypothetical protein [Chloroflexota bacterium]
MKIKIWRQFASNHSNSFTVVGTFPTVEKAEEAAAILQQLMEDIFNQGIGYRDAEPLWAEIEIAQNYGVEGWDQHVDWVEFDGKFQQDLVHQFDKHVSISNGSRDTNQGATAIPELLEKMGAKVLVKEEMRNTGIHVDLMFKAPDEATADKVYAELLTYITFGKCELEYEACIPWAMYAKGEKPTDAANLENLYKQHSLYKLRSHQGLADGIIELRSLLMVPLVKHNQVIFDYIEQTVTELEGESTISEPPYDERRLVYEYKNDMAMWFYSDTKLQYRDLTMTLKHAWFPSIGKALPALIRWLTAQGCTDINYELYAIYYKD